MDRDNDVGSFITAGSVVGAIGGVKGGTIFPAVSRGSGVSRTIDRVTGLDRIASTSSTAVI